eukprot:GHRQ01011587.1.p3 GENE.GHRQ01011587.1~~GHRQ01011587.1.p3  ORF type:complete len:127 (+),score=31.71 GHRQ01011587.1:581-961(+)
MISSCRAAHMIPAGTVSHRRVSLQHHSRHHTLQQHTSCCNKVVSAGMALRWLCRGHGTALVDGRLIATLCGVVQRVDKLIYVQPVKSRCLGRKLGCSTHTHTHTHATCVQHTRRSVTSLLTAAQLT